MGELLTSQFWLGLGAIIWVNIILSGDNAVVIALAARSLPAHQQTKAVIWGAGAAVVLRIVLIADLVMSLDNVIAVAAVAKGSISLLVLGLLISIPLVVFGATMLMKIMESYPVIITVGAALIGYVSGEMLVTDPVVLEWFKANAHWMVDFELFSVFGRKLELSVAGLIGAALVVVVGKWLAARKPPGPEGPESAAQP